MFITNFNLVKLVVAQGIKPLRKTPVPTISDCITWFIKNKNIFIQIEYCFDILNNDAPLYFPRIVDTKTGENMRIFEQFETPELAAERGIEYAVTIETPNCVCTNCKCSK